MARNETSVAPHRAAEIGASDKRLLTPAAERALAEADARRQAAAATVSQAEVGGREGPDPIRYGDWENGGIASDF